MREIFTYGSVGRAPGNRCLYLEKDARDGMLVFKDPKAPFEQGIPIKIGYLDPIDTISGQKARLNNLGYNAGPVDGPEDEKLIWAIQEFQCDQKITVDGVCGPLTQNKLKEIHGC